jgi:hypothetical protein
MERANLKNRKAIFEICSLLFSFWRRSRRITPRIHVIDIKHRMDEAELAIAVVVKYKTGVEANIYIIGE